MAPVTCCLGKQVTTIFHSLAYFFLLLHVTSGSKCCLHPAEDSIKERCQHVSLSNSEQPSYLGLHHVFTVPPQSCHINITEHLPTDNIIVVKTNSKKRVFGRISDMKGVTDQLAGAQFHFSRFKEGSCPGQCLNSNGTTNESITVEVLYVSKNPGITLEYYGAAKNTSASHQASSIYDRPQNQQPYPHNPESRRRYRNYGHAQYARRNTSKYQRRVYAPPNNSSSFSNYHRRPRLPYHHPSPYNNRQYRHYRPAIRPVVLPNSETRQAAPRENRTRSQLYNSWNRRIQHPAIIPTRKPVDYNRVNYRHYPRIIPNRINNRQAYNPRINNRHFPRVVPPTQSYTNKLLHSKHEDLSVKQHPSYVEGDQNVKSPLNSLPDEETSSLISRIAHGIEFYEWKIAGFTECSRTCGGGIQQTRVVCVKVKSQVIVTAENCNNSTVPNKQEVTCHTEQCEPSWQAGNWSSCSTSCGPGSRTRTIECTQIISRTTTLKVSAERCSVTTPKPAATEQCHNNPCARWSVEAWSKCNPECGPGSTRKRLVKCVSSHLGTSIPGRFCPRPRPRRSELCENQNCPPKWYVSKWSGKCSSNCGEGITTRQVICVSSEGQLISSSRCDPQKKPKVQSPCSSTHPCGGTWFTGVWSECSADCGEGQRTREVTCLKAFGTNSLHVVSEENCQDKKPATQERCTVTSCHTDWYYTEWSDCSTTCGKGQQMRQVKCFNKDFKPSSNCSESSPPPRSRPCNQQSCEINHQSSRIADHSCFDRYGHKNCQLVMRARLCNNSLYKKRCCITCSRQKQPSLG
ncbi:uncharacterized protein LOC115217908 [Argonauta hians]